MVVNELWITRHGFREDWVNPNPHYPTHLPYDPPLSKLGLKQAEELGNFLKDKGIEAIYCSPFYRCLQTVAPLVKKTYIPIYLEYAMSEWYGMAYPEYQKPASSDTLKTFFPKIDTSYESSIPIIEGQETVEDCHKRVKKGLDVLLGRLDSDPEGPSRILLAGHAATVVAAVRALMNNANYPISAATCSITRLVRREDGDGWDITMGADTSFLSDGSLRPWTFAGDIPDYEQKKMKKY
ncbi:histidine phosphatase superfamily [Dichotomocladium elegans]|nr:histidine phosphatase superfamily [Dichotomocladium elegans]